MTNGCNYCRDSLEGCKEIKHPQAGETFGAWGSNTKRTFYLCPWCGEVWMKEEILFLANKVGEPDIVALGKNPKIRVG